MDRARVFRQLVGLVVVGAVACGAHAQCEPTQADKLRPDIPGEQFGSSVAIEGDRAVVGAWADDDYWEEGGAAYVFERIDGVWTQVVKLRPPDGHIDQNLGWCVAIAGDVAVVGALRDNELADRAGAAYVFERIGGVWTEVAKLLPTGDDPRQEFGKSVAISGDTIVVGAPYDWLNMEAGAAYVFERVGGVWTKTAKLTATDGSEQEFFGSSVDVDGDTLIAGMNGYMGNTGAVYVFERSGGVWSQTARLSPWTGSYNGQFISLSGDTLIAGVPYDYVFGQWSGSAIVFDRDGGAWTQVAELFPDDGVEYDLFGWGVSVRDDRAIVQAISHGPRGTAYLFEPVGGTWTQVASFESQDTTFDTPLDFDGSQAIFGSNSASGGGAAVIFDLECGCPADFNGDGVVDTRDFVAFLNAWAAGDASADFDGNGVIDTRDFIAYLNLWAAGC